MGEDTEDLIEKRRQGFKDWNLQNAREEISKYAKTIASLTGKPCAIVMITQNDASDLDIDLLMSDIADGIDFRYSGVEILHPLKEIKE